VTALRAQHGQSSAPPDLENGPTSTHALVRRSTPSPTPWTLDPELQFLDPDPQSQNPKPRPSNAELRILNSDPRTRTSIMLTPSPAPRTLHPALWTYRFGTTGEPRVLLYRDSAAWCPYCQKAGGGGEVHGSLHVSSFNPKA
jgi:hypothetical protein